MRAVAKKPLRSSTSADKPITGSVPEYAVMSGYPALSDEIP